MGGGLAEDLDTINQLAEEYNVTIPSISNIGGTIIFSSRAENFQVFREFVSALEESGRFLSPITPPEGYPWIDSGTIKLQSNPDA